MDQNRPKQTFKWTLKGAIKLFIILKLSFVFYLIVWMHISWVYDQILVNTAFYNDTLKLGFFEEIRLKLP